MAVGGRSSRPWQLGASASLLLLALCFIITIIIAEETDANSTKVRPARTITEGSAPDTYKHVALRHIQLSGLERAQSRDISDTSGWQRLKPSMLAQRAAGGSPKTLGGPKAAAYSPPEQPDTSDEGAEQHAQITGSGRQVTEHRANSGSTNNAQLAPLSNRSNGGGDLSSELRGEDSQKRLMELKQKYMTNRAISDTSYYVLLAVYSLFILVGAISNSLICLTVILKPKILSPRNIFIVNLAGSDLLLCVFTMPFSFIEMSMKMWQLGSATCKLVAGLQATSIYVSTISITAIALDRHKVIVNPTHQETAESAKSAAFLLASIWIGALLLSTPLFTFRTVQNFSPQRNVSTTDKFEHSIRSINFCIEKWPFEHGRGIYSVISMIFQYVVPITIVSVAYASINQKLKKRLRSRQRLTQMSQQKRQSNLINKTHSLLIYASVIFGCSWLPLNLLNVMGDFSDIFKGDSQRFRIVFAVCHLIGCSSACCNPILYGYYNKNFRKEFHQVYTHHMHNLLRHLRRLCCPFRQHTGAGSLPQSNSSADLGANAGGSTDFSSYNSNYDSKTELDGDDSSEFAGDDEDQELTSTTSSLDRRLRSFNSSVSANAIADQLQRASSFRQVAGMRPTSALEIRTAGPALERYRASAGQLTASGLQGGALKRTSYVAESLNNSGSHQYSFQTITSGRYTNFAGRAVRFCLCINGSSGSSSGTAATITQTNAFKRKQPSSNQNQQHLAPGSPNPSSHRAASRTSPVQQQRQRRLQSFNDNPPEVSRTQRQRLRLHGIRRKRRLARRYRNFVNDRCECHCHSHRVNESAGGLVRRRISQLLLGSEQHLTLSRLVGGPDRRSSAATVSSGKWAQAELHSMQVPPAIHLNLHRVSLDRVRANSSSSAMAAAIRMDTIQRFCDNKNKSNNININEPSSGKQPAMHGRRVWLRFFPAIERYYNEPLGAQECGAQRELLKSQAATTTTGKQSAANNTGGLTQNLIEPKVESDRHFENGKAEESVSQTGNFMFGRRAELSISKPARRRDGHENNNNNNKSGHPTIGGPANRKHCAICRRKVVAEYRKLVDASKASRARKRAKANGALGEPGAGIATTGEQKATGRARKEVALETKAADLAPPIGVGLLSVVLPSNERSTSEFSGQERSTSVVVLNVTDLEAASAPQQPVAAEGLGEKREDNDCETTNFGDREPARGNSERAAAPINESPTKEESKRDREATKDDNNIGPTLRAAADNMQSSQAASGQFMRRHSATTGSAGFGLGFSFGSGLGEHTNTTGRDDIICLAKQGADDDLEREPKQTSAIMKPDVGEADRKRMSMAYMATGESDLIESKPRQNLNWNAGEAHKSADQERGAIHLQASRLCSRAFADNNNINNDNDNKLSLDEPGKTGCVAPTSMPIMQLADQHSHASSGSSLCACAQLRSSSCTCSVSGGLDSSSGSLGSSSAAHSNASSSRTNNSVSGSSHSSSGSSSSSSPSSSSSAASASSLTSSQPRDLADQEPDPLKAAQPQQMQQQPHRKQRHQSRQGQRTISSSFSTGTAPRRPDPESMVASSVLQLSAPTSRQPSAANSSCSIGAPDSCRSLSGSLEAAARLAVGPTTTGGSSNSISSNVTQISGHLNAASRDESSVQPRKLSVASCGSPTGANRQLATINELSFRQPVLAANGLPVVWRQQPPPPDVRRPRAVTAAPDAEDGVSAPTAKLISKTAPAEAGPPTAGRDRERLAGQPEVDMSRRGGRAPDSTHYVV